MTELKIYMDDSGDLHLKSSDKYDKRVKYKWVAVGWYGKNILAIRCRHCGRIVGYPKLQDLYRFCPGCGSLMDTEKYVDGLKENEGLHINPGVYTDQFCDHSENFATVYDIINLINRGVKDEEC